MPVLDVGAYLEERRGVTLDGVRSEKYPDGRAYTFASPSLERGLWMHDLRRLGAKVQSGNHTLEDMERLEAGSDEADLFREVMGPTLDELLADGVTWAHVQGLFELLFQRWTTSEMFTLQLVTDSVLAAARTRDTAEAQPPAKKAARKTAAKKTAAKKPAKASA